MTNSMTEPKFRYRIACSIAWMIFLFADTCGHAQLPGMPQPKHYPWSDASLSPDAHADLVIKEMTLDEKLLLVHGQGLSFFPLGRQSPMAVRGTPRRFQGWAFRQYRWLTLHME